MKKTREIRKIWKSRPTIEGAGVHLHRVFGHNEVPQLDPFLLLDDFRSNNPAHYLKGFPWHPHRGIETITYMLHGSVEHGDSIGNKGVIHAGEVQWMTAGSGIIHQEMPKGDRGGVMSGFQLWANLPASHKMMDPRYQELRADEIPIMTPPDGERITVISGKVAGISGPVRDIIAEWVSEDQTARAALRDLFASRGIFRSKVITGKETEGSKFRDYFSWEEPVPQAPSHRIRPCGAGRRRVPESQYPSTRGRSLAILERLFVKDHLIEPGADPRQGTPRTSKQVAQPAEVVVVPVSKREIINFGNPLARQLHRQFWWRIYKDILLVQQGNGATRALIPRFAKCLVASLTPAVKQRHTGTGTSCPAVSTCSGLPTSFGSLNAIG
jgi:hypothetical protein